MQKKPIIIYVSFKGKDILTLHSDSKQAVRNLLRMIGIPFSNASLENLSDDEDFTITWGAYIIEIQNAFTIDKKNKGMIWLE